MTEDTVGALTQSIYDRLRSDARILELLAPSAIDPPLPGVYSAIPVPPLAVLPYVVISGPVSVVPVDTFDAEYQRVMMDIHCYDSRPENGGGSIVRVSAIAARIRTLLHRKNLCLDAGEDLHTLLCEVAGTVVHDDAVAFGRVVVLRSLIAT